MNIRHLPGRGGRRARVERALEPESRDGPRDGPHRHEVAHEVDSLAPGERVAGVEEVARRLLLREDARVILLLPDTGFLDMLRIPEAGPRLVVADFRGTRLLLRADFQGMLLVLADARILELDDFIVLRLELLRVLPVRPALTFRVLLFRAAVRGLQVDTLVGSRQFEQLARVFALLHLCHFGLKPRAQRNHRRRLGFWDARV